MPSTAGVEHGARTIEVDPVAEIGFSLGLAADDRREMEDRVGAEFWSIWRDQSAHRVTVGDVAGDELDSPVFGQGSAGAALSNSTSSSTGPSAEPRSSRRIATRRRETRTRR